MSTHNKHDDDDDDDQLPWLEDCCLTFFMQTIVLASTRPGHSGQQFDHLKYAFALCYPVTLTFDLWRNNEWVARMMGYPCSKFGDCSFSHFRVDKQTHRHTHRQMQINAILLQLLSAWVTNTINSIQGFIMSSSTTSTTATSSTILTSSSSSSSSSSCLTWCCLLTELLWHWTDVINSVQLSLQWREVWSWSTAAGYMWHTMKSLLLTDQQTTLQSMNSLHQHNISIHIHSWI